jgi:TonB family protein
MRNRIRVSGSTSPLLCLLAVTFLVAGASAAALQSKAVVPEKVLRNFATRTVMPEYPAASKEHGTQGRAVALLQLDESGRLVSVKMLEAPDDDIEKSVVEAIKKWRFDNVTRHAGEGVRIEGRLTFYFEIIDGQARVRNPKAITEPRKAE